MAETLGERIRRWRLQKGLSQGELATLAGISQTALSRVEANRFRRPATVRRIALALGVEPTNLVDEEVALGPPALAGPPSPSAGRMLPLLADVPPGPPGEAAARLGWCEVSGRDWGADRYVWRASDDALHPLVQRDDLVLVEYRGELTAARAGRRLCTVVWNGRPLVRYVRPTGPGGAALRLEAPNPDAPALDVAGEDELRITGVVLKVIERIL